VADLPVDIVANVLQERHDGRVLGLRGVLDGHRILLRSDVEGRATVVQRRAGGTVLALTGSLRDGQRGFAPKVDNEPITFNGRPRSVRDAATMRARELLCSFLDRRQRAELRASGGLFWEHTPSGWFRLGRHYDIRYRPHAAPEIEQSLCVVTSDLDLIPDDDLWVNLLLMLRADPTTFRATGYSQQLDTPSDGQHLAHNGWPADRAYIDELRYKRADDWTSGRHLEAAYTDLTIAHLERDADDRLAALWHAVRCTAVIAAQATVLTNDAERDHWDGAHAPVYDVLARFVAAEPHESRVEGFARDAFAGVRQGLLCGPAVDQAEADLLAWFTTVRLIERTFTGVFR